MHVRLLLAIAMLTGASFSRNPPTPLPNTIHLPCNGTRGYQDNITVADFSYVALHIYEESEKNMECEISFSVESPLQHLMAPLTMTGVKGVCSFVWIYEDYSATPNCKKMENKLVAQHLRFVVTYPNRGRELYLVITSTYLASLDCILSGYDPTECCYEDQYKALRDNNELAACDDKSCISRERLCDGVVNCHDKSDEYGWHHLCRMWPWIAGAAVVGVVVVVVPVVFVVRRVMKARRAKAERQTRMMREMQTQLKIATLSTQVPSQW